MIKYRRGSLLFFYGLGRKIELKRRVYGFKSRLPRTGPLVRKDGTLVKKSTSLLAIFLIMLLLISSVGCGKSNNQQTQPQKVELVTQLYYANQGNEKLVSEQRTVNYQKGQDKYKAVLNELLKGPKTSGLVNNIPSGTTVRSTSKKGTDLTVDFSRFKGFPGSMAEIMAVGSVVNTMISAGDVKRVKILVDGKEFIGPSGEPRGFMTKFTNPSPAQEYTLYFGNQQADKVVPEKRQISLPEDASEEQVVTALVQELIRGPQESGHYKTIPPEAQIKSVSIESKTAWLDFSREMHTKHWHGAAGEAMTINSIVNTLTELPGIKKVGITVEGKPLNIEHVVLEEPVGRNPSMIGS